MNVSVREAKEVDLDLVSAFARLIPQLSSSSPPPTADDLAEIIANDRSAVFVACNDDEGSRIVGTATLVTFRIPTGLRARVEDVVVDETARGQRVGEALTQACIDKAATLGCKNVDLTSNSARQSAHRLYERMGFQVRDTNVWRYTV